jgi:hypothetical protein
VYFDRSGVATIADVPDGSSAIVWLIDASGDGVLVDVDRERSRDHHLQRRRRLLRRPTGNVPGQYVWDDDPQSPTYAGPTSPFASGTPFGIVPYYYDTPILDTVARPGRPG